MDETRDSVERDGAGAAAIRTGPAEAGGWEKILLAAVLVIVGGALGFASWRVLGGPAEPEPVAGDVAVVSHGEEVDLVAHAVAGKYTIYDFYADWCPPCRVLDVQLRDIAARHDNVAVRKVDIIDWTSAVVRQHEVMSLPHIVLFGPDGREIARGDEALLKVAELFERPQLF